MGYHCCLDTSYYDGGFFFYIFIIKVEVTDKNFYALILTIAAGINIIWVILLLKISERSVDGDIRSGILLLVFVILFLDIIVFKLYILYQEHKRTEQKNRV